MTVEVSFDDSNPNEKKLLIEKISSDLNTLDLSKYPAGFKGYWELTQSQVVEFFDLREMSRPKSVNSSWVELECDGKQQLMADVLDAVKSSLR
ncbi:MAG: hypothetical protein KCHDKBKB_01607 [Elusimicrobia bacterium]|nr:hypothetical protein [Elusimicrobiota bacterium]